MGRCCSSGSCSDVFDERFARRLARRYRRRGLDPTARTLFELVRDRGTTVLEIGGGIGEIEIELLQAGAERATNVELSGGYEAEAERLLAERGLEGRVERTFGDIATETDLVEAADVVVMNRVVCCYPEMPALVGAAAAKARASLR